MQPHGMLSGTCKHGSNNFCTCCDMESYPERYKWYPIWTNKLDNEPLYVLFEDGEVYKGIYRKHGQDIVFKVITTKQMIKFSRGAKSENN